MAKLLKDLPAGSLVKEEGSKYYGKTIVWRVIAQNHQGYPDNSTTLLSDKVITFKAYDAKEPDNSNVDRKKYGNNRYIYSNIRTWLNSAETSWYKAKHSTDKPPNKEGVLYNPYEEEKGFMTNLTPELKSVIIPTKLKVLKNDYDEGGLESSLDKVFLLSYHELGLTNGSKHDDGVTMEYFQSSSERKAYPTKEAIENHDDPYHSISPDKTCYWLTRTPKTDEDSSEYTQIIDESGYEYFSSCSNGSKGVRPAVNIKNDVFVSSEPDSDGVYSILWNQPPTKPDKIILPDTVMSEQEINIKWSKSTDPDGDRVGYNLERRINSEGWIQIYQGNELSYSDYLSRHTDTVQYRVRAYDDKGATSEWGTTDILNVIHNRPPTISGADEDLGIKDGGFEISYKISDLDKDDKVRVIITLDGKVIYSKENHELDKDSSIIITDDDFLSISPGEHTILIKAIDNSNAMDIRIYTFNRIINETTVTLKEPLSSGQDISKAIMSINKTVPPEVETTVLVTNNAYDEKPVWIDVTQNVVQSRKIFFENQVATAGKFGFNFKISIKRNSDGEPAYIRSVGGNFE